MPNNKELVNPIDPLLDYIALAIEEWKSENTPEFIEKKVKDLLDQNSDEIVMKLLGFDKDWGEWRIDCANGRDASSIAGQYMQRLHHEAIQNWLAQFTLPKLSPKSIKRIEEEAQQTYEYELGIKTREMARRMAESHANELIREFTASRQVENRLKLMALLEPKEAQDPNNQPQTN